MPLILMGETPMLLTGKMPVLLVISFPSAHLAGTRPANLIDEVAKTAQFVFCQTIHDLRINLLVAVEFLFYHTVDGHEYPL
jgi:hypothetical protein